jgi:hypothetical protein
MAPTPARYSRTGVGSNGRVGQEHNVVRGLIQLADRGAYGDGLADAHLGRDDAQQRLCDAEASASPKRLASDGGVQLGVLEKGFAQLGGAL